MSLMDVEESKSNDAHTASGGREKPERMFSLKKWNAVAMWSWDVECDTCAICRQVRSTHNRVSLWQS